MYSYFDTGDYSSHRLDKRTSGGFLSTTLTKEGEDIAKNLYERHKVLTKSLLILGVDEKNANADACEIEHDISEDTFKAIKEFVGL
mgnify:CR=1 FL=1